MGGEQSSYCGRSGVKTCTEVANFDFRDFGQSEDYGRDGKGTNVNRSELFGDPKCGSGEEEGRKCGGMQTDRLLGGRSFEGKKSERQHHEWKVDRDRADSFSNFNRSSSGRQGTDLQIILDLLGI